MPQKRLCLIALLILTSWLYVSATMPAYAQGSSISIEVLKMIDEDKDGDYSDAEVMFAMDMWLTGAPFPGTDITINDATMIEAMRRWILGIGPPSGSDSPPPSPTNESN